MPELLLATSNPGKLREFRSLLTLPGLELYDPQDLGLELEIEEQADYAVNASLKAAGFAKASGNFALGDDSGLEVDLLGGAPGPLSARMAGPGKSDRQRRQKLLGLLRPHPRPWLARFRCVAALASPDGEVSLAEGICRGEIIPADRGSGGFGYDPIFLIAGTDRTMAELTSHEKNQISHRALAVKALLPTLRMRLHLPR